MYKSVKMENIPSFILGTIIGALVGGNIFVELPIQALQVFLAIFIFYTVWAPKLFVNKLKK